VPVASAAAHARVSTTATDVRQLALAQLSLWHASEPQLLLRPLPPVTLDGHGAAILLQQQQQLQQQPLQQQQLQQQPLQQQQLQQQQLQQQQLQQQQQQQLQLQQLQLQQLHQQQSDLENAHLVHSFAFTSNAPQLLYPSSLQHIALPQQNVQQLLLQAAGAHQEQQCTLGGVAAAAHSSSSVAPHMTSHAAPTASMTAHPAALGGGRMQQIQQPAAAARQGRQDRPQRHQRARTATIAAAAAAAAAVQRSVNVIMSAASAASGGAVISHPGSQGATHHGSSSDGHRRDVPLDDAMLLLQQQQQQRPRGSQEPAAPPGSVASPNDVSSGGGGGGSGTPPATTSPSVSQAGSGGHRRTQHSRLPDSPGGSGVVKVSGGSRLAAVAGKVAHDVRAGTLPRLMVAGAASISTAVRALMQARRYLKEEGQDLGFVPVFRNTNHSRTLLELAVVLVPLERGAAADHLASLDNPGGNETRISSTTRHVRVGSNVTRHLRLHGVDVLCSVGQDALANAVMACAHAAVFLEPSGRRIVVQPVLVLVSRVDHELRATKLVITLA
jgi:stage V sporulation protein SpoVS